MAEQTENNLNDTLAESTKIDSTPYLKIAEHGRSSRTKALKLKIEDVVVAVDGTEFRSTSDNLVDLLSSEEHGKWLLTIFRDGQFFEIFTVGPLGGVLKFTSDEEAREKYDAWLQNEFGVGLNTDRIIYYKPGYYKENWIGNCLAIGLASGFAEPLEATSIHGIIKQVYDLSLIHI